MRGLWRIALIIGLVATTLGASWATAGKACACSCADRPADEVVADASAIVEGRAVSESVEGTNRTYRFEVDRSYKSEVSRVIAVTTHRDSPTCGASLPIGQDQRVVLHRDDGAWTTTLCSSLSLRSGPMPASAGKPFTPVAASSPSTGNLSTAYRLSTFGWIALSVAGAVVLGGAALFVVRRRR